MTALSAFGNTERYLDGVEASDQEAVNEAGLLFLRLGFALLVFVAMWGATRVTAEFRNVTVAPSAAACGGLGRLMAHHALAVVPGGFLFGVAGLFAGAAPGYVALRQQGMTVTPDGEFARTAVGIVLVSALAAPWGTCFGWFLRRTLPAVVVLVGWTMVLETVFINWIPERVGRFLPANLQNSLTLDRVAFGDIGQPAAAALLLAWIIVLDVVAFLWMRSRDLSA
ncbi:hypothetical protein [Actinomyces sp. 2119]|uniref:hypothetical protein n=1 Tax=Actinomyces sp. 2119 TaxID=2321393 RepID=UPI0011C3CF80|nr:hypothetical protein [Actinomyces sp. 2119]